MVCVEQSAHDSVEAPVSISNLTAVLGIFQTNLTLPEFLVVLVRRGIHRMQTYQGYACTGFQCVTHVFDGVLVAYTPIKHEHSYSGRLNGCHGISTYYYY